MFLSVLPLLSLGSVQLPPVDHQPLVAQANQATMLDPARDRWGIATVEGVGPRRELGYPDGGKWTVFDVRLRVLDGRNLAAGTLDAFWSEDDSFGRRPLLERMVGTRVLIRLAPVRDGRFLIVSGTDEDPEVSPTYADAGTPLLSLVLPTGATTLDPGSPAQMRFASLWRAGASLSPSAYPLFERYVSAADLPVTGKAPKIEIRTKDGGLVGRARPAGTDVLWLRRFTRTVSPEFALAAEEILARTGVVGTGASVRELIRLSLRAPERFPDGLFRVLYPDVARDTAWEDPTWPPTEAVIASLAKRSARSGPGIALTQDLLTLLRLFPGAPAGRAALLPLLTDPEPRVRVPALATFAAWQSAPPKDADPVAWHTARAKMSPDALRAARGMSEG